MLKRILAAVILCASSCLAQAEVDMTDCDPVALRAISAGSPGSFDYNDPMGRPKLPVVENAHFTHEVESLTRGHTGQAIMPDLQYTLNAYPNHPRALQSLVRFSAREKTDRLPGSSRTTTCFLKRAIVFAPNDMVPRMLLAKHYSQQGKVDDAIKVLQEADAMAPGDANLAYNMGLLYVEKKQYDQALAYALLAYQAGFPLPGLREKLKRAGQWREPAPKAVDANVVSDGKPAPADATTVTPVAPPARSEATSSANSPADAAAPAKP